MTLQIATSQTTEHKSFIIGVKSTRGTLFQCCTMYIFVRHFCDLNKRSPLKHLHILVINFLWMFLDLSLLNLLKSGCSHYFYWGNSVTFWSILNRLFPKPLTRIIHVSFSLHGAQLIWIAILDFSALII